MSPRRVQRSRIKGWRAPVGAVYVGRGTRWGNPARILPTDGGGLLVQWDKKGAVVGTWPTELEARRYATELYRGWLAAPHHADLREAVRRELAGRDLMCWCPIPGPGQDDHCHAAVLLRLANGGEL